MRETVYVGNSKLGGVSAFRLDMESGRLLEAGRYMGERGLAPLAVSPDRRFLYAAERAEQSMLLAFALDASTGELHYLNSVASDGPLAYLSVDAGGRFLLGASYHGGFVAVWPLGWNGMIQTEPSCLIRPGRNPHCVILDAANRFAYVPVLGNDLVAMYRFDAARGLLTPNAPAATASPREAGPRHIILSPDNRYAYLLTEMGGEVVKYGVDRDSGLLAEHHAAPLLPPEQALPAGSYTPPANATGGGNSPTPVLWCADIRMTPDNRFLYASERTQSTLSCFAVDAVSGRLDLRRVHETEKQPRGFAIDFFGRHMVVAGEVSGYVASYRIDRESGELALVDRYATGTAPNWVEIVAWL